MPLTLEGNCPLGRFKQYSHLGGGYDKDPVEICPDCNFVDVEELRKGFDLNKICLCPKNMTDKKYRALFRQYCYESGKENLTKPGFQRFVSENF